MDHRKKNKSKQNKCLINLLVILFFNIGYSQCSFSIEILNCFNNNQTQHFEYSIFKRDSIIGTYQESKFFQNFSKGEYYIVFENLFKERSHRKFELKDSFPVTINLCIDSIPESIILEEKDYLISNLENNEEVTLKVNYSGCFKNEENEVVFSKKENRFYLIYNKKKKNITKKINIVRSFERELFSLRKTNIVSTSNTTYFIKNNNLSFIYTDPNQWSGFDKLLIKLNLKKKKQQRYE